MLASYMQKFHCLWSMQIFHVFCTFRNLSIPFSMSPWTKSSLLTAIFQHSLFLNS